ncbi:hypothetical protein LCGC14_1279210 [marine sediment metagenome]|uniref:Laminin G domain-containing protein n=1 Tax=marine sediment metagenome TaxID=412755 RepID=A0A0F9KVQ0_9ZZZZ
MRKLLLSLILLIVLPLGAARNFDGSTDDIDLSTTDALANLTTYTLFVMAKTTSSTSTIPVYGEGNSANDTAIVTILFNNSVTGAVRFLHRDDASTLASIDSGNISITDGAWHRVVVVRRASNDFEMWSDGVSRGTTNNAPGTTTINGANLGRLPRAGNEHFPGDIAEVTRLSVAISDDEAVALSAGNFSPLFFTQPRMYIELIRDVFDRMGSITPTVNGTTVSEHPPIIYPTQPISGFAAAGAPPVRDLMIISRAMKYAPLPLLAGGVGLAWVINRRNKLRPTR